MFKRILPAAVIGYFFLVIVNWGCTKLDTTKLGSDLIPAVDNVYTFADTLDIENTQGFFNDSFKIAKTETQALGRISADPLFGETQAHMFFQMKPTAFPYYIGAAKDTLVAVDSVVLCLAFTGFYGDSTVPQNLKVYKINQKDFVDSAYKTRPISYQPLTHSTVVGEVNLNVLSLKDTIRLRKDSVVRQIRIKLSSAFAADLFAADTSKFRTDSLFRSIDNGLAVKAEGSGNGLMYISLTDAKSRLEIHYKRKLANTGQLDTSLSSWVINSNDFGSNLPSATSNYISRNYTNGTIATSPSPFQTYLATGPGTYTNIRVPALDTMSNRIIHRAEIYMEQDPAPGNYDSIFYAPPYMYIDLIDSGAGPVKWKPLYYDLSPNEPYDPDFKKAGYPYFPGNGGVDFTYFGNFARTRFNYMGEKVIYYAANVTRHVQQIVTKGTPNYTMRLFPAYSLLYPQYSPTGIPYNNPLALGRVRLKSGAYPDDLRKMRMVVIYSKL